MSNESPQAGNYYEKYSTKNPIEKWMVQGFLNSLDSFVSEVNPSSIHEVGCGERYLFSRYVADGRTLKGSDLSAEIIAVAQETARHEGIDLSLEVKDILEITPERDSAELIICAEVMEHLEDPIASLKKIFDLESRYVIFSVPREPLWRILNMLRLKYLGQWGNTPGHLNHWGKVGFARMLKQAGFEILAVNTPLPWIMVLCKPQNHQHQEI